MAGCFLTCIGTISQGHCNILDLLWQHKVANGCAWYSSSCQCVCSSRSTAIPAQKVIGSVQAVQPVECAAAVTAGVFAAVKDLYTQLSPVQLSARLGWTRRDMGVGVTVSPQEVGHGGLCVCLAGSYAARCAQAVSANFSVADRQPATLTSDCQSSGARSRPVD